MSGARGRLWLALVVVVGACTTGSTAERFSRRYGPFGATTELRMRDARTVVGELLGLDDSTVVVLEKQRVVVVPFAGVRFVGIEGLTVDAGSALWSAPFRREAVLRARYPRGIAPEVMARLLARAGQQAADTVRGKAR